MAHSGKIPPSPPGANPLMSMFKVPTIFEKSSSVGLEASEKKMVKGRVELAQNDAGQEASDKKTAKAKPKKAKAGSGVSGAAKKKKPKSSVKSPAAKKNRREGTSELKQKKALKDDPPSPGKSVTAVGSKKAALRSPGISVHVADEAVAMATAAAAGCGQESPGGTGDQDGVYDGDAESEGMTSVPGGECLEAIEEDDEGDDEDENEGENKGECDDGEEQPFFRRLKNESEGMISVPGGNFLDTIEEQGKGNNNLKWFTNRLRLLDQGKGDDEDESEEENEGECEDGEEELHEAEDLDQKERDIERAEGKGEERQEESEESVKEIEDEKGEKREENVKVKEVGVKLMAKEFMVFGDGEDDDELHELKEAKEFDKGGKVEERAEERQEKDKESVDAREDGVKCLAGEAVVFVEDSTKMEIGNVSVLTVEGSTPMRSSDVPVNEGKGSTPVPSNKDLMKEGKDTMLLVSGHLNDAEGTTPVVSSDCPVNGGRDSTLVVSNKGMAKEGKDANLVLRHLRNSEGTTPVVGSDAIEAKDSTMVKEEKDTVCVLCNEGLVKDITVELYDEGSSTDGTFLIGDDKKGDKDTDSMACIGSSDNEGKDVIFAGESAALGKCSRGPHVLEHDGESNAGVGPEVGGSEIGCSLMAQWMSLKPELLQQQEDLRHLKNSGGFTSVVGSDVVEAKDGTIVHGNEDLATEEMDTASVLSNEGQQQEVFSTLPTMSLFGTSQNLPTRKLARRRTGRCKFSLEPKGVASVIVAATCVKAADVGGEHGQGLKGVRGKPQELAVIGELRRQLTAAKLSHAAEVGGLKEEMAAQREELRMELENTSAKYAEELTGLQRKLEESQQRHTEETQKLHREIARVAKGDPGKVLELKKTIHDMKRQLEALEHENSELIRELANVMAENEILSQELSNSKEPWPWSGLLSARGTMDVERNRLMLEVIKLKAENAAIKEQMKQAAVAQALEVCNILTEKWLLEDKV